MLEFRGLSRLGTPIWINRWVAAADYTIALGRIFPHVTHGYEGGYKMIVPGVAGFDTILRNHSFNFSPDSVPGILENPSRREADAIGRRIGIDYLVNVVVNAESEPCAAFGGWPETVYRRGVAWGDREVWGATVPARADVVVVSPGKTAPPPPGWDLDTLYRAARVAKRGGAIIGVADAKLFLPTLEPKGVADEPLPDDADAFNALLPNLEFAELARLHEKRNWSLDERAIQWRLKAIRGEFYRRRSHGALKRRRVLLTPDPNNALAGALRGLDPAKTRVVILPEARTTLAKTHLYTEEED